MEPINTALVEEQANIDKNEDKGNLDMQEEIDLTENERNINENEWNLEMQENADDGTEIDDNPNIRCILLSTKLVKHTSFHHD